MRKIFILTIRKCWYVSMLPPHVSTIMIYPQSHFPFLSSPLSVLLVALVRFVFGPLGSLLYERIHPLSRSVLQGPVPLQTNEETQAYARSTRLTVKNSGSALFRWLRLHHSMRRIKWSAVYLCACRFLFLFIGHVGFCFPTELGLGCAQCCCLWIIGGHASPIQKLLCDGD